MELVQDAPQVDTSATKTDFVLTATESAFVKMVFEEFQALMVQAEKHRNARLAPLLEEHKTVGQVTFAENADHRIVMTDTQPEK